MTNKDIIKKILNHSVLDIRSISGNVETIDHVISVLGMFDYQCLTASNGTIHEGYYQPDRTCYILDIEDNPNLNIYTATSKFADVFRFSKEIKYLITLDELEIFRRMLKENTSDLTYLICLLKNKISNYDNIRHGK